MSTARRAGRVVTFYSYKGGTGRSMALANIAWVLAGNGKRVLVIDWDLEAPGLHRYFKPFLIDHELSSSDGLMDLIDRYANEAIRPLPEGTTQAADWWYPLCDYSEHILSLNFEHFPAGGKIDLLPAGRQSESYAVKVSAFNWQNFYDRLGGGGFLDAVRQRAQQEYDYVLIDSRTGVSDTAGICTAQMPDTLVVCFTYNNQSIKGAAAVAASARRIQAEVAAQRHAALKQADGKVADTPLPYLIYPVPMRVDAGESERLALRQTFARESFQALLDHVPLSEQPQYWAGVEVPHRVYYAYEEVLAPFKDDAHDPKTVLSAFVRLTRYISGGEVHDYNLLLEPGVRERYLGTFAETPQTSATRRAAAASVRESEEQSLLRRAEAAWHSLVEEERAQARSVLCRLVRIGRDEEGGGNFPIRVAMGDFDAAQQSTVATLAQRGLLSINTEVRPAYRNTGPEQVVALADEKLLAVWPLLQRWLLEDREFLLWRQNLRGYLGDWDRTRETTTLVSGSLLGEARLWALKRGDDLNHAEHEFIRMAAKAVPPPPPPPVLATPDAFSDSFDPVTLPAYPREPTLAGGVVRAAPQAAPSRLWVGVLAAALVMAGAAAWMVQRNVGTPSVTSVATATSPPDITPPKPSAAALTAEADRLYVAGQLADAAQGYRRALQSDAAYMPALLQLGRVLDRSGDVAGALDIYDRAIKLQPQNPKPLIERAASRITQRQFDEAISDLNDALKLDDHNALAYFNRGAAYENLGRPKDAISDYSAAIQWQTDMVPAYLRRATLQEKSNRQAALADYQSVLRLAADPAAAQTAQERLKALGTPDKQASTSKQSSTSQGQRVLLQYADRNDQANVDALRKALAGALAAVSVPAGEVVSMRSSGDVRYFFEADRVFAERVQKLAEAALAKQGKSIPLKVIYRDANALARARQGTVEIWLPSLSLVAPARSELRPPADTFKK